MALLRTQITPATDAITPARLLQAAAAAAAAVGGSSSSAALDPAIAQAQDLAPLIGFFLSLFLTCACFWRLSVFVTASLKYRWDRPQ